MPRALAAGIAVLGSAIALAACGTGSTEPLGRAFGALDTPASSTTTTTAPPPPPPCGDPPRVMRRLRRCPAPRRWRRIRRWAPS